MKILDILEATKIAYQNREEGTLFGLRYYFHHVNKNATREQIIIICKTINEIEEPNIPYYKNIHPPKPWCSDADKIDAHYNARLELIDILIIKDWA